jgi:hypothetical protein
MILTLKLICTVRHKPHYACRILSPLRQRHDEKSTLNQACFLLKTLCIKSPISATQFLKAWCNHPSFPKLQSWRKDNKTLCFMLKCLFRIFSLSWDWISCKFTLHKQTSLWQNLLLTLPPHHPHFKQKDINNIRAQITSTYEGFNLSKDSECQCQVQHSS